MGFWFRLRVGPFGYTARPRRRRRRQSYRAYKASRRRREGFARRYEDERAAAQAKYERDEAKYERDEAAREVKRQRVAATQIKPRTRPTPSWPRAARRALPVAVGIALLGFFVRIIGAPISYVAIFLLAVIYGGLFVPVMYVIDRIAHRRWQARQK
jgi:Flp pilus assembly protein TadB